MGRTGAGNTGSCSCGQGCAQWNFNPVCWWGMLCSLLVSCLASDSPALESAGSMVGLMVTSHRAHTKLHLPGLMLPGPSPFHGERLPTHTSTGDPPTLAGQSSSVSCGVTAPVPWVLVHARFCLCPPRVESLFPSVLWKSCNQILLTFKVSFPGNS